jgi:erythronate-4-phosphate dehydrogenase
MGIMRIVVDENMPYAREAFATLGDVTALPGRKISREDLRDVEVLAVRSITQVNADLLDGTAVRYVGTATIGTDHLDMAWMDAQGIRHCAAPGCNADSVADYMTASLLHVARRHGLTLAGLTLGVVGCGNVGSRVVKRGRALGMRVVENDPPLARATGDACYRPIEEILGCDFVTIHTPLEKTGPDATYHLVNADFLAKMAGGADERRGGRQGAGAGERGGGIERGGAGEREAAGKRGSLPFLINASRGAVVDGAALKAALASGRIAGAVLDVWEGEPRVDTELLTRVEIATPHIAGYSFDGKVNGTTGIYRQVCAWLGREATWDPTPLLPAPDVPRLEIDAAGRPDEAVLREAVFAIYPIQDDDARMRVAHATAGDAGVGAGDAAAAAAARGAAFDRLRKDYPRRREFARTTVVLRNGTDALAAKLRGLTFRVDTA